MALSKADTKYYTRQYQELEYSIENFFNGDAEWFLKYDLKSADCQIDYYVYLNTICFKFNRLIELEKILELESEHTFRYRKARDHRDVIKKAFPDNVTLLNDSDFFRSSFIVFMQGQIYNWFPSADDFWYGDDHFSNYPMMVGLDKLVVKNFIKIINKMLIKYDSKPIGKGGK
jgi:hypothetical protein